MSKRIKSFIFITLTLIIVISNSPARAQVHSVPDLEASAYDLINAVSALRAVYGLPAYRINSILMFTAQNQADFMSANGVVVHSGPGGSSVTERLLAAGYPLGGDLSLGGFRSENIIAINVNMSAQDAVTAWMGDAPHQYTMLSPDLTEIGGGVAIAGGLAYYVIDCARPAGDEAPPTVSTQVFKSGTVIPANEAAIHPVTLSTPNANGDVIHEVQSGQTLWQIAIAYDVKIDDIKRLNNLFDNNIYPGNKLLIKQEVVLTLEPATETIIPETTATVVPSATLPVTLTTTAVQTPARSAAQSNNALIAGVIAIIALAILGGGFFTWLGSSEKQRDS